MFRRQRPCPNCRELLSQLRARDAMIRDLVDRNMFLAGNAWSLPPSLAEAAEVAHPGRRAEEPVVFDADELETL